VEFVIVADLIILILVLVLPLASHAVERNLEAFLFIMGAIAAVAAGALSLPLVRHAMADPIPITIAVLISGLLFKWFRGYVGLALARLRSILPTRVVMAFLITVLALLSSVITVIIASLLLVELISLVRFSKEDEARLTVFACMALGLGAVLTPVGEPLSTIATAKLNQDFWFLLRLLGWWVIPGVVAVGASIAFLPMRADQETLGAADTSDNYRDVLVRAFKVYIFVMALVLLGEGFKPMVDRFIIGLDARILYWINMISAILDNATLTAAEIGPGMHLDQVRAALMGLLISGGMLIPGNIPNIIAANKLGIRSRTWARWGIPLGLALLVLYFVLLFVM
jgi:predicted cation transporter